MRILCTSEARFTSRDGVVSGDGPARYASWANYLEVFDEVVVLARLGGGQGACDPDSRADGPGVSFCALPDYRGPWEYLQDYPKLKALVRDAVADCDACILRVPGLVGRLVWKELKSKGESFALEVVGDPWDALGPGTWRSVLRPVFRRAAARDLRAMCREAAAIHYVTESTLQKRYPPGRDAYAVGFSDALIGSAFASQEKIAERWQRIEQRAARGGVGQQPVRIGFIGSLEQMYKGPDVLLRAGALCRHRGLDLEIVMAGDGRCAEAMKELAKRLGIGDRTTFAGQLPFGKPILDLLDSMDLFVMPSRAEGLPRALLEAMARGCPCIGSDVGGIPELLPREDLVPAGDAEALGEKILEVGRDSRRLRQMAEHNLQSARKFSPELLQETRRAFLRSVRERSEVRTNRSADL